MDIHRTEFSKFEIKWGPPPFSRKVMFVRLIGKSPYVLISNDLYDCDLITPSLRHWYDNTIKGEIISIGTFRLRLLEYHPWREAWIAILLDSRLAGSRYAIYRFRQWCKLIHYRLLMTAVVWGLGVRPPEGEAWSWKAIRAAKKQRKV